MDMRRFMEQHDRARQLLLEGEDAAGLDEHVAACAVCGTLADRLAEIDRMVADVPEPRPELLERLLRPGRGQAGTFGASWRVEMLWPLDVSGGSSGDGPTLRPLVMAVEADGRPRDAHPWTRVERCIVVARHPITIGRGPDLDVPVWDQSVSRRHAQLDWRDGAWVVRDMESTNGVRINGARLGASEVRRLELGDRVEIGHAVLLTVQSLLPAMDPAGFGREMRRMLGADAAEAGAHGGGGRREDLRARLLGVREETVRLREHLSSIAMAGAGAEALPLVYERLSSMLAMIEREVGT